jgi:K+-sensing histidine kinase KdpD
LTANLVNMAYWGARDVSSNIKPHPGFPDFLGLRISRTIVESHGGPTDNSPRGAIFHFTMPSKADT